VERFASRANGAEYTFQLELVLERLRQISDSVGVRVGWDFSRMRTKRAPVPWDYSAVVRQFLTNTDCVLDVGTGGGELFLALAPCFRKGIGIDVSTEMVEQAFRNRRTWGITNIDFKVIEHRELLIVEKK
jgi:tRNA/tmRNA/rRNA uracil-C5-methylase (TrmA/RlmC/RlmD family)